MVDRLIIDEWLAKAENDFKFAQMVFAEEKEYYDHICFHFQYVNSSAPGYPSEQVFRTSYCKPSSSNALESFCSWRSASARR
jgi:hypothetical protein